MRAHVQRNFLAFCIISTCFQLFVELSIMSPLEFLYWQQSATACPLFIDKCTLSCLFVCICAFQTVHFIRRKLWLLCYDSILAAKKNISQSASNELQFDLFARQQEIKEKEKKTIDLTSPEFNELDMFVWI